MPDPWAPQIFETLESTQDPVKDAAAQGGGEGYVVQALSQSAGRGRQGREWISQLGNLFLSVLLRPNCRADRLGELSLLVGAALAQALDECVGGQAEIRLKWPNDAHLDGRKCAGILIESDIAADGAIKWLAVGIGVNIEHAPEGEFAALREYSPVSRDEFRDVLLASLQGFYGEWKAKGFAPVRDIWLSYAYPEGTPISVKVANAPVSGYFAGLEPGGGLILQTPDGGRRIITAGDVFFGTV